MRIQDTIGNDPTYSCRYLADLGVCEIERFSGGGYRVELPYCAFRYCGGFSPGQLKRLPVEHQHLAESLKMMNDDVDERVYSCEPWQLWESFGACFHAIRINSFLVLKERIITMSKLFVFTSNSTTKVVLKPMKVFRTSTELSKDTPDCIPEVSNANYKRRWIGGSQKDPGVIVMNGPDGAGVDISFSLLKEGATNENDISNYMVFLDQRKRVAVNSLSERADNALVSEAKQA